LPGHGQNADPRTFALKRPDQSGRGRGGVAKRRRGRPFAIITSAILPIAMLAAALAGPIEPASAALSQSQVSYATANTGVPVDSSIDRSAPSVTVVVTMIVGVDPEPVKDYVAANGGTVLRQLSYINGLTVKIAGSKVDGLGAILGVTSVSLNRSVQFLSDTADDEDKASPVATSLDTTGQGDGAGVGIALIDTGVTPHADLAGRVVYGPNFAGDGTNDDLFGHGTAMAGAMAGDGAASGGEHRGIATEAKVVSVKVAGRDGVTYLDVLIDALSWVRWNRLAYNVKVANLSWGVASTQMPGIDPIGLAVEKLVANGVTVVAAAGNSGPDAGTVTTPGDNPGVLTVGAFNDDGGTDAAAYTMADFSSRGPTSDGFAKPDIVAPGQWVVTAKAKGSTIDVLNPNATVDDDYIRGNGTSQAAALTSGTVALLLAKRALTPAQVKNVLRGGAVPITGADAVSQGAGRIDLKKALAAAAGVGLDPSAWRFQGQLLVKLVCENWLAKFLGLSDNCLAIIGMAYRQLATPLNSLYVSFYKLSSFIGASWVGRAWRGNDYEGRAWRGGDYTGRAWRTDEFSGRAWRDAGFSGRAWRSDFATSD